MSKSVKFMRKEAKERGLKGYSTLSKDQLIQLLNGEMIKKGIKKNQKSKETQTEFKQCEECSLDHYTILTVCYSVPRNTSPRSIMQTELARSVY